MTCWTARGIWQRHYLITYPWEVLGEAKKHLDKCASCTEYWHSYMKEWYDNLPDHLKRKGDEMKATKATSKGSRKKPPLPPEITEFVDLTRGDAVVVEWCRKVLEAVEEVGSISVTLIRTNSKCNPPMTFSWTLDREALLNREDPDKGIKRTLA